MLAAKWETRKLTLLYWNMPQEMNMPALDLRMLTSKWWFYFLLFLVPLFVPPYTSEPLAYDQVGELMGEPELSGSDIYM